jgi:Flp pilus assembly protein TadB
VIKSVLLQAMGAAAIVWLINVVLFKENRWYGVAVAFALALLLFYLKERNRPSGPPGGG